jgi:DNA repair exonuclease SbcCD ATPase subunit
MISGPEALGSIDEALQQVRRQMQSLDDEIETYGQDLTRTGEAEVEAYRRLAVIRLDHLTSDSVIERLDETDRRVKELLALRAKRLADLRDELLASHETQAELESQRQAERQRAAQVTIDLDKAEAATQERLRQDAGYREQLAAARRADDVAKQAEAKTKQAEQDLTEKGQPYQTDRIFTYLWNRGFGTSRYSANPLARLLDGWVARLCRYHDARPNYSMLLEIPARLREHAERVRAAATQELTTLKGLEEKAAEADGIHAIQQSLATTERRIAEIDAAIKSQEDRYRNLSTQQAAYGAGEDELFRQCIDLLSDELRRDGMIELRQKAAMTATAEDNVIVQQLETLKARKDELQQSLHGYQQRHDRHLSRLQELEKVRHQFKRERYDGVNSTFSNGAMIGAVLSEFLRGMATSPEVWDTIQRHQRPRRTQSDPDFGSGGFPGPRGGAWSIPMPRGPSVPIGGGGDVGGGFRTGGGF